MFDGKSIKTQKTQASVIHNGNAHLERLKPRLSTMHTEVSVLTVEEKNLRTKEFFENLKCEDVH